MEALTSARIISGGFRRAVVPKLWHLGPVIFNHPLSARSRIIAAIATIFRTLCRGVRPPNYCGPYGFLVVFLISVRWALRCRKFLHLQDEDILRLDFVHFGEGFWEGCLFIGGFLKTRNEMFRWIILSYFYGWKNEKVLWIFLYLSYSLQNYSV